MGMKAEVKTVKKVDKTVICERPKDAANIMLLVVIAVLMANV